MDIDRRKSLPALLLLSLSLLWQCSKEDPKPEPKPTVPLTREEMILGEWVLKYRISAWAPDTIRSDKSKEYMVFWSEDSVYEYVESTVYDTSFFYRFAYEFDKKLFGADSVPQLVLFQDSNLYFSTFIQLRPDTLVLDSRYKDGALEFYLRK